MKMKNIQKICLMLILTMATGVATAQNMSRYITLTVKEGEQIQLRLQAGNAGTLVKIVSGSAEKTLTVGTSWTKAEKHTAGADKMTIYGDITGFNCALNNENLTAIDVSNNTELIKLDCGSTSLSSLDVSKNPKLIKLDSGGTPLSSLDVSKNTELEDLSCRNTSLSSLDVSNNSKLKQLDCRNTSLSSLDVSNNPKLRELYCDNTSLSSLDMSKNTELERLYCYKTKFTTQTIDDMYCSLPDRSGKKAGEIYLIINASDINIPIVKATNGSNALNKNWKVMYDDGETNVTDFTGTFVCPVVSVTGVTLNKTTATLTVGQSETLTATVQPATATNKGVTWSSNNTGVATVDNAGKVTAQKAGTATITVTTKDGNHTATCTITVTIKTDVEERDAEMKFSLLPTVVTNGFMVTYKEVITEATQLEIYSLSGAKVAVVSITQEEQYIDVSSLPAGVYFVHLSGTTYRIIKK